MEDQWISKLRKKLANHKEPVPEGLWEDIEMALKKKKHPSGSASGKILFWGQCIGAAAVIAIVCLIGRSVFMPVEPSGLSRQVILQEEKTVSSSPHPNDWAEQKDLITETPYSLKKRDRKKNIQDIADFPAVLSDNTMSIISASELSDKNGNSENEQPEDVPDEKRKWSNPETDYNCSDRLDKDYMLAVSPSDKESGRLVIGLFASNLPETAQRHEGYGGLLLGVAPPSIAPDDAVWGKEPMTDILLFNQNKETYTEIKHKQPVRVGVSFRYHLNDRFSLESGLAYTRLLSHLTSGSDSYHYETEQSLQYIGVPLNLDYSLWKNKFLDFYLSAGGMVEKCVSGKSVTDYILNNKIASTENKEVKVNPLQCSVNAAAGIQLNLLSRIGIYVEPGISYYFDNGSPVETIYKEKPLNFNLEVGVRFSFK